MRGALVLLALLAALALAPEAPAGAQSGDLTSASGSAMAVQPDGKIVVAGFTRADGGKAFALARYDVDGSLDSSFGAGGRVVTAFAHGSAQASGVAIGSDGKIVVAGTIATDEPDPHPFGPSDFVLARYNPDGSLDSTFSGNGKLTTDFRERDAGLAVALAPDGRIVAAGSAAPSVGSADFALARYRRDGTLDRSFSRDGRRTTDFGAGKRHRNDIASTVALEPDGKIVAAGESGGGGDAAGFALARYDRNGSLDRSFSGDGKATPGVCDLAGARDVALQPDGRIVAAGAADCGFLVARLDAGGALDSSFGGDGTVVTDFGKLAEGYAVTVQPDGRIVAAGQSEAGENAAGNFAVARYDSDGSPDASFASGGRTTTGFSEGAVARDVALAPGGRIVAAGFAGGLGSASRFALARYNPDGSPDRGLAGDGTVETAFGRSDLENADHTIAVGIRGRHVALRHRRVRLVLTCPASELSPPCGGKLILETAQRVRFHGHTRRVVFAKRSFSIDAGTTGGKRRVTLRLSKSEARLVRRNRTARRVSAIAHAHDAAGNHARSARHLTLVP